MFHAVYLLVGKKKLNLNPDPNVQIISGLTESKSIFTTLMIQQLLGLPKIGTGVLYQENLSG